MNTHPTFSNKYLRALKAIGFAIRYPSLTRQFIREAISFMYGDGNLKIKNLPLVSLEALLNKKNIQIVLKNVKIREGTVSPYEIIVISSLISAYKPTNILEIGTFDGNTTLQMAANASNALVHTIDLPKGTIETHLPILNEDLKFVTDQQKNTRRYLESIESKNIMQHFGDSTAYDFSKFTTNGPIDFCFIDGGHSYECVKSDTEMR